MIKFDIRADIDKATKEMTRTAKKQIPYATSIAINKVALAAEKEIQKEINSKVNNPTAFTRKGTFVSRSDKAQSPITAIVGVKDIQAKYLDYTESGGISKAFSGSKPVPTSRSSIKNKAGNIPRKKIRSLLNNKRKYFSGVPIGGDVKGVYQRMGKKGRTKLELLAVWEPLTKHRKITRFGERVLLRVQRDMEKEIRKAVAAAVATAR